MKDLFNSPSQWPDNVRKLIESFNENIDAGCDSYVACEKLVDALNVLGYTADFGLDGSPYNLREERKESECQWVKNNFQEFLKMDLANTSAGLYLEQAAKELSGGLRFETEEAFKLWLSDNFELVIKRASELNISMLKKVKTEGGQRARKLLSVSVYERLKVQEARSRANQEYNNILTVNN